MIQNVSNKVCTTFHLLHYTAYIKGTYARVCLGLEEVWWSLKKQTPIGNWTLMNLLVRHSTVWSFEARSQIPCETPFGAGIGDCNVESTPLSVLLADSLIDQRELEMPRGKAVQACISVTRMHTSGYQLHPCVVDATLHLATAAQKPGRKQVMRVPSGFGAILNGSLSVRQSWPSAIQASSLFITRKPAVSGSEILTPVSLRWLSASLSFCNICPTHLLISTSVNCCGIIVEMRMTRDW